MFLNLDTPSHAEQQITHPRQESSASVQASFWSSSAGLMSDQSTLNDQGAWMQLDPVGPAPSPRSSNAWIYDPVRDRIVMFGGYGGGNDTWELSLSGVPAWTQLFPSGPLPPARENVNGIYDPVRDRMLIFGGGSGGGFNDVWALTLSGTPTWSELHPSGALPPPRAGVGLVYDPVRDRMILFGGGFGGGTYLNDVWALTLVGGTGWQSIATVGSAPAPRAGMGTIYDPVRDRMVIFGGGAYTHFNDTWALALSGTPAWSEVATAGDHPAPRENRCVYDPLADRMLLFGGKASSGQLLNDTWALPLAGDPAWTELSPTGVPPAPRMFNLMEFDPVRGRVLVFGGCCLFNDVWALTLNRSPDCSNAHASIGTLWPPNHHLVPVTVDGITDPDGDVVSITILAVTQDEMVRDTGSGQTCPDAIIHDSTVDLRAERSGRSNGRVYGVHYRAEDGKGGSCEGIVNVCVPHNMMAGGTCPDDGQRFSSTGPCVGPGNQLSGEVRGVRVAPIVMARQIVFEYSVPTAMNVKLSLYDVSGRVVAHVLDSPHAAGTYRVGLDGTRLARGVYHYQMVAGDSHISRPLVFMR